MLKRADGKGVVPMRPDRKAAAAAHAAATTHATYATYAAAAIHALSSRGWDYQYIHHKDIGVLQHNVIEVRCEAAQLVVCAEARFVPEEASTHGHGERVRSQTRVLGG